MNTSDKQSFSEGQAAFRAGVPGNAPALNAEFTKRVVKLPHAEMMIAMASYSRGWLILQQREADEELKKMGFSFPGSN